MQAVRVVGQVLGEALGRPFRRKSKRGTSRAVTPKAEGIATIEDVVRGFGRLGYVLDTALATAVYLVIRLGKPLLIEGHAGVGKTEVMKSNT